MIAQLGKDPNWLPYAGSAVFLVGLAWLAMRFIRRTVQKDLDPANTGKMRPSMAMKAEIVPPALVKEALAKGLVTSQQLATMSPIERQFLFQQLAPKLGGGPDAAPAPLTRTDLPLKPTNLPKAADVPQLRSTQAIPVIPGKPLNLPPLTPEQIAALGPPPAPAARPGTPSPAAGPPSALPPAAAAQLAAAGIGIESDGLRVHCPFCGVMLKLPADPPHVTFCDACGGKTAVRVEEQGRLVINAAPPGVTRRPVR
jgi:hypothetical protein